MTFDDIPETSGIYRIVCKTTKLFYLGSAVDLRRRWRLHYNELQRKDHHNSKLQRAWNKYAAQSFTFEILEFVLPPFLLEREQYWLDKLKPFGKKGFNINLIANSRLGVKATPETIERLIIAQTGKHGKGIPRAERYGYTHSPATCKKMKNSHLGQKPSQPPPSFEGKNHRPESIEKIRLAQFGKKQSAEAVAINRVSKAAQMKTLIIIAPDGTEHLVTGIKAFCKEHHLDCSNLMRVAKGEYNHHKGWTARFP